MPSDPSDAEWTVWFKFQSSKGGHTINNLNNLDGDDDNLQTAVATIYYLKDAINSYSTDHGTPYRQIREWHIGGHDTRVVKLVQAALNCREEERCAAHAPPPAQPSPRPT